MLTSAPILRLPEDVLTHLVLSRLGLRDLLRAARVCTSWRRCVHSRWMWHCIAARYDVFEPWIDSSEGDHEKALTSFRGRIMAALTRPRLCRAIQNRGSSSSSSSNGSYMYLNDGAIEEGDDGDSMKNGEQKEDDEDDADDEDMADEEEDDAEERHNDDESPSKNNRHNRNKSDQRFYIYVGSIGLSGYYSINYPPHYVLQLLEVMTLGRRGRSSTWDANWAYTQGYEAHTWDRVPLHGPVRVWIPERREDSHPICKSTGNDIQLTNERHHSDTGIDHGSASTKTPCSCIGDHRRLYYYEQKRYSVHFRVGRFDAMHDKFTRLQQKQKQKQKKKQKQMQMQAQEMQKQKLQRYNGTNSMSTSLQHIKNVFPSCFIVTLHLRCCPMPNFERQMLQFRELMGREYQRMWPQVFRARRDAKLRTTDDDDDLNFHVVFGDEGQQQKYGRTPLPLVVAVNVLDLSCQHPTLQGSPSQSSILQERMEMCSPSSIAAYLARVRESARYVVGDLASVSVHLVRTEEALQAIKQARSSSHSSKSFESISSHHHHHHHHHRMNHIQATSSNVVHPKDHIEDFGNKVEYDRCMPLVRRLAEFEGIERVLSDAVGAAYAYEKAFASSKQ